MKVVLVGLHFFTSKVAKDLNEIDGFHNYIAIEAGVGIIQKAMYFWNIITADVLYQIGGSHACGGTLRLAMALNKKIIMHWVGTDVLNLKTAFRSGKHDANLLKRSIHLCEVDWIQKELAEANIYADIAQIACFENKLQFPPEFPSRFVILSYVGKGREIFYGINKLSALGKIFPEIEIRVAGISEYSETLPSNIRLLGWVDDMKAEYQNCVLYLRLPEHDGLAFSVLEALASGRYVGYANEFSWTQKIEDETALVDFVKFLIRKFNMNRLEVNWGGYNYVMENYSKKKVMNRLADIIRG